MKQIYSLQLQSCRNYFHPTNITPLPLQRLLKSLHNIMLMQPVCTRPLCSSGSQLFIRLNFSTSQFLYPRIIPRMHKLQQSLGMRFADLLIQLQRL